MRRDPSLRIALLEKEIAGFGASGRNGSWCSAGFSLSPGVLAERFGAEPARSLILALCDTVDEVGQVAQREGIDIDYVKGGMLRISRGEHQRAALERLHAWYVALGLGDRFRRLSAGETRERVRVAGALAGLRGPDAATVQPAALARGLARVVERMGARIYEGTEVTGFSGGRRPRLDTLAGPVTAQTVVLCGEAYLSRLPGLRRQILPVYSLIALTEPLSSEQWSLVGWEGRECLASFRYTVDYLARTSDDRILFGSRGAPYHVGSAIADEYDRHAPTHENIREMFTAWFPTLRETRFTHSWGGPVGMPRDSMPTVSYDLRTGIATARGYTGQGVATSNLAGRTLASLISETEDDLTRLPFVAHRSPNWEPEPLRWVGVRYVQAAYGRIDEQAERTGRAPSGRSMAERLGRH